MITKYISFLMPGNVDERLNLDSKDLYPVWVLLLEEWYYKQVLLLLLVSIIPFPLKDEVIKLLNLNLHLLEGGHYTLCPVKTLGFFKIFIGICVFLYLISISHFKIRKGLFRP